MRRSFLAMCAALWTLSACGGSGMGAESTLDQCSNGRDDDGDGQIDCADIACTVHAFCASFDGGMRDAGDGDVMRPDGGECLRPIDLVFSVDVSSSMESELASLKAAAPALFERIHALDPGARVSLVVFVDDVLAIADCEPLTVEEFSREIDTFRQSASSNRNPVSSIENVDCPENSLDALTRASACEWRDGAARVVVHMTDDTFAERPTVLSGPFGGGIVVQNTYAETQRALSNATIRLVAVTAAGVGADCGAGRSPDVGRGFHTPFLGMPSLPESTGGEAMSLDAFARGELDIGAEVSRVAERACTR
jgi:hypothetical protein